MHKKSNVIVINGRHYDAEDGKLLSHEGHLEGSSGHEATYTGATHKPTEHKISHGPARHVAAHHPKPATTLMRQAVKKPPASLKRHIKVQGHLDSSAARSSSKILIRPSSRQPNLQRLQNPETKRSKGRLISHFSPELFAVDSHRPAIMYGSAPVKHATAHVSDHPASADKPKTVSELFEHAVHHAATPSNEPAHKGRRKLLGRRTHA